MRQLKYAHSFEVVSNLPEHLRSLQKLAMNYRWTWDLGARHAGSTRRGQPLGGGPTVIPASCSKTLTTAASSSNPRAPGSEAIERIWEMKVDSLVTTAAY